MKADRETTVRLLKTARGQIEGVLKMIEEDRYCIDISNQILASMAVLKKANKEILKGHMQCCIKDAVLSGNEEEKIAEMLLVIDKL